MLRFVAVAVIALSLLLVTQPTAAVAPSQGATRVMLVQLGGGGPDAFGCGDRILAVPVAVRASSDPMRVALDELLLRGEELARRNGLYDAFAGSQLRVQDVSIEDRAVTVRLTGTLRLAGECDIPRVREQLRRTVLQYREFRSARFLLDGVDLEELFDQRG